MEWRDKEGQLIVPPDNALKRKILRQLHDHWGARHPGRDETIRRVQRQYFWPLQRNWIDQYIKGCATCQQNKNLTRNKNPTLQNHCPRKCAPFHTDSPGSDHWTTQISGIQRDTNHCRPWLLTRGHHRTPNCTTILQTCLPLVQPPQQSNIQ
jgi:hypothetical protein